MDFYHDEEQRFREAWSAVQIARSVDYSLFTFGESELPYYLVSGDALADTPVSVRQGEVRIRRPMIITPDTTQAEFEGFFENSEEEDIANFLLARSARFSNLQFVNRRGDRRIVSDSLDATVDRLNRKLDDEDEDRTAILTAPPHLAGVAVLKYAAQRVWESTPDNIQELRERGFLP